MKKSLKPKVTPIARKEMVKAKELAGQLTDGPNLNDSEKIKQAAQDDKKTGQTPQDEKKAKQAPQDPKKTLLIEKLKPAQPNAQQDQGDIPQLLEFPDGAVTLKMPKKMRFYLWIRFPVLHPYITAAVILSLITIGTFTWLILNPPESVLNHIEALKKKNASPPMATLSPTIPKALKREVEAKEQQRPQLTYRQYMAIGKKYHTAGNHDYALNAYMSAILLSPSAEAYNAAASEAMEIRSVPQAESYLKAAIVLNPNYALARYNLGILYSVTGNPQAASDQYQALAKIDQTLANALANAIDKHQARGQTQ